MTAAKQRPPELEPAQARDRILDVLKAADQPLSLASIGSMPAFGRKLPGKRIWELVAVDVEAGTIFAWGAGKNPLLWSRDPKTVARERILDLAAKEILTRDALKKRAVAGSPRLIPALVQSALAALTDEGRLRPAPPAAGSKSKRLIDAQRPEAYLESAVAELLQSFGLTRSAEKIRALLHDEHATQTGAEQTSSDPIAETSDLIFAALQRLALSPGATVTFLRLRQQPELTDVPKEVFDRAALRLQSDRKALLSVHDHAAALPPEERDKLVTDGQEQYYVSIYAR